MTTNELIAVLVAECDARIADMDTEALKAIDMRLYRHLAEIDCERRTWQAARAMIACFRTPEGV
jgi:hypothetical protein